MPDPHDLPGLFVVEVGERQAWPFVQFCDNSQTGSREVRLYIDTRFVVRHATGRQRDGVAGLLELNNVAVSDAIPDGGGLSITFADGTALIIAATPEPATAGDVWWLSPWLSTGVPRLHIGVADNAARPNQPLMPLSPGDHVHELESVGSLGRALALVFDDHGLTWFAAAYASVAVAAESCLAYGFDQVALNSLSAMNPTRPEWLDPRAPAFNLRREPWMDDAARLEHAFRRAMFGLRVVGDAPDARA